MPVIQTCRGCGSTITNEAPFGHCPKCLVELGFLPPLGEPAADSLAPSETLRRFGDYEFLELIGRGGMGLVYKARHLALNRLVALKLIPAGGLASEMQLQRFRVEAQTAAKLEHPNIVPIYEVGEHEGQPYFTMRLVEGEPLNRSNLESLNGDSGKMAHLMATLARAVHYAHQHGVLHRDLKPSNILVDKQGTPYLSDFGLAKLLDPDATELTLSGAVVGTPSYMPPEQASGQARQATTAADIYSLGAILYELLTGGPPFQSATPMETMRRVCEEEPEHPTTFNGKVNRDLATICLKCLEKDPSRRYPSAHSLAEDLERFIRGEPISARPVTSGEKFWRWSRRNPKLAASLGALMLVFLVGFAGVAWQWKRAEEKAQESRRHLYAADMILAQAALEAGTLGHAQELLRKYLPRRGEPDLRGWEWRYAWNQCRSDELFTLTGHTITVSSLALSSTPGTMASGSVDGGVILWDLENKRPMRTLMFSNSVYALAFSKNDKELIVGMGNGEVSFWNCETWQPIATLTNRSRIRALKVSPDQTLLAAFGNQNVIVWNMADREEIARLELHYTSDAIPGGMAFSPDSSLLAYNRGDGAVVLWDRLSGKRIAELEGHERYVSALAFSPDGSVLVSGSRDRTVRVWEVGSRRQLRDLGNFAGFIGCVAFSPGGELLAVAGAGQRIRLFHTGSWEELNTLKGHSEEIWSAVFLPDGRLVTGAKDGAVKCWPVSKKQQSSWQLLPADASSALLLPDARFAYVTHTNRSYSLWSTDPLAETGRYPFPMPHVRASTISPDGKLWAGASTNLSRRNPGQVEGVVKVFDRVKERFIAELPCSGDSGFVLAFSPDGQMLAGVGNDYTCRVWKAVADARPPTEDSGRRASASAFQEIAVFGIGLRSVAVFKFSRSGRLLAVVDLEAVTELWDIGSKRRVARLPDRYWKVNDVVISQDDSTAVTASAGGRVKVWDIRTGSQTAVLGGQLNTTFAVAFSSDESRVAACGGDGRVRLWDMQTKQEVATLKLHKYPLHGLAFSSEGLIVWGDGRLFALSAPKE